MATHHAIGELISYFAKATMIRSYAIAGVIVISIVAISTMIKAQFNQIHLAGIPESWPSDSVQESKEYKLLTQIVRIIPSNVVCNGKELSVIESWVEKRAAIEYRLWWFETRRPIGGWQLVIKCSGEALNTVMIWKEGEGESFSRLRGRYCSPTLQAPPKQLRIQGRSDGARDVCFSLIVSS
jgi:hypothetical protein